MGRVVVVSGPLSEKDTVISSPPDGLKAAIRSSSRLRLRARPKPVRAAGSWGSFSESTGTGQSHANAMRSSATLFACSISETIEESEVRQQPFGLLGSAARWDVRRSALLSEELRDP